MSKQQRDKRSILCLLSYYESEFTMTCEIIGTRPNELSLQHTDHLILKENTRYIIYLFV